MWWSHVEWVSLPEIGEKNSKLFHAIVHVNKKYIIVFFCCCFFVDLIIWTKSQTNTGIWLLKNDWWGKTKKVIYVDKDKIRFEIHWMNTVSFSLRPTFVWHNDITRFFFNIMLFINHKLYILLSFLLRLETCKNTSPTQVQEITFHKDVKGS